jgi:hypothetical protein
LLFCAELLVFPSCLYLCNISVSFVSYRGCSLKLGTWKGSCLLGPKPVTCMVGVSSFLYQAIAGTPSSLPRLFIINHSHSISGEKLASC